MLARGAACVGANVAASWIFLPSSEPPVPFLMERSHHRRLIINGSNPRGGPIGSTVGEARRREGRGNDKLQAREAREGH